LLFYVGFSLSRSFATADSEDVYFEKKATCLPIPVVGPGRRVQNATLVVLLLVGISFPGSKSP